MLNTFSRNGDIHHHVAVSPDVSSLGRNNATILNHFLNSRDFHHAAVPPDVLSLSGNRLWLPKMIRETCSGEMVERGHREKKIYPKGWVHNGNNIYSKKGCMNPKGWVHRGHRKIWYNYNNKMCFNCGTRGHIAAACTHFDLL